MAASLFHPFPAVTVAVAEAEAELRPFEMDGNLYRFPLPPRPQSPPRIFTIHFKISGWNANENAMRLKFFIQVGRSFFQKDSCKDLWSDNA